MIHRHSSCYLFQLFYLKMSLSETLQQNLIYSLRKEVDIMDYISVKAASEKWGISERRIQKLCEENRIDGTEKFGRAWMIPKDAEKPVDGRMKTRNKQEENHGI
ncbi:DNA-binding protein [Enterococcus faecium]|uniref:DNA-binding protein n=1 Tax=Enterococcus faecium TaxID=1352 RepID=UPI003F498531